VSGLVSVLIPVYNVERYVKEAIESIQKQTYKNIEIIVVDDGSTDSTFNIVADLAKRDGRIKLYKNEKNLRIVRTLNRAVSLASGEYIVRMDGDDISMPERIEVLLRFIIKNPEFSLVGSAYLGIDENGSERGIVAVPISQELINRVILFSSPVSHIWLATKDVYDRLDGYRADTVEDYDFLLRMHSSNILFTNVSDVLYKVRLREGNTASSNGLRQAKAHQYVVKLYKERLSMNQDSYSEERFESCTNSNRLLQKLHSRSQEALETGLRRRNIDRFLFFVIAMVLSPYTFNYIFRKIKYKYEIKKDNKK
jgi:glycosyltransferase involved in cell wall biosynthesis